MFLYNLGYLRPENNLHWAIPRSVLQSFGPRLADLVGLSGTNPAEHEWFSGPIYAQSYLGGAGRKSKRASDQGVQF